MLNFMPYRKRFPPSSPLPYHVLQYLSVSTTKLPSTPSNSKEATTNTHDERWKLSENFNSKAGISLLGGAPPTVVSGGTNRLIHLPN